MMKTAHILCFIFFAALTSGFAQGSKALAEADRFYSVRSYDMALAKFLEAIQAGEKDAMVHYKTGVCYQKSEETNDQIKAIPYFEYAVANGKGMPASLHYELGSIYLKDENIQKALEHLLTIRGDTSSAYVVFMSNGNDLRFSPCS